MRSNNYLVSATVEDMSYWHRSREGVTDGRCRYHCLIVYIFQEYARHFNSCAEILVRHQRWICREVRVFNSVVAMSDPRG